MHARPGNLSLQHMMQCSWTLGSRTASSLCIWGNLHGGGQPPACMSAQLQSVAVGAVLQVKLLKDLFRQALGDEGAVRVDINTIDGFQVPVCAPVTCHPHSDCASTSPLDQQRAAAAPTTCIACCP